jgi:hypothetical protein
LNRRLGVRERVAERFTVQTGWCASEGYDKRTLGVGQVTPTEFGKVLAAWVL